MVAVEGLVIGGTLFTVAAGNVPVVAAGTFAALTEFVVAFGLAGVFAGLAVELDHAITIRGGTRGFKSMLDVLFL